MLRRTLMVVAALAAALSLVPLAGAALVHIRVEGKTLTIFGGNDPEIVATTPLDALQTAARVGEFYVHVTASSFGNYVDQIGFYPGAGDAGWAYKVDGISPPVGADQVQLKDGDHVLWYYATFGPTGGPPTLEVKATTKGCYTASAFDDNGKAASVSGLVWHVGSKKTVTGATSTPLCPGPHPGVLVRATATGAVRSNAVK